MKLLRVSSLPRAGAPGREGSSPGLPRDSWEGSGPSSLGSTRHIPPGPQLGKQGKLRLWSMRLQAGVPHLWRRTPCGTQEIPSPKISPCMPANVEEEGLCESLALRGKGEWESPSLHLQAHVGKSFCRGLPCLQIRPW